MSNIKDIRLPSELAGDSFRQTREFLRALSEVQILNGRLIEGVSLSTTATAVVHRLGRAWKGYIVVSRSANTDVYHTDESSRNSVINLLAGAPVTVSLWVF